MTSENGADRGLWRKGPTAFRGIGLAQFLIHLVQVHNVFDTKTYSSLVYLSATDQGIKKAWPKCYHDLAGDLTVLRPMMTTMPISPIKEWNRICYFSNFSPEACLRATSK